MGLVMETLAEETETIEEEMGAVIEDDVVEIILDVGSVVSDRIKLEVVESETGAGAGISEDRDADSLVGVEVMEEIREVGLTP